MADFTRSENAVCNCAVVGEDGCFGSFVTDRGRLLAEEEVLVAEQVTENLQVALAELLDLLWPVNADAVRTHLLSGLHTTRISD